MVKHIYDKKQEWTTEEIIELQKLIRTLNVASLDEPIGKKLDGEEMVALGMIIKDDSPSPQDIVEQNDMRRIILEFINKLAPREITVIKMRFGFDCEPKTLEEIGLIFGVTRERIRQIETKAMRKLRWHIMVKGKYRSINDF